MLIRNGQCLDKILCMLYYLVGSARIGKIKEKGLQYLEKI